MSHYLVGGLGLWVDSCSSTDPGPRTAQFFPAGTEVDDSLPRWSFLQKRGPPIDAAPLDWPTYEYMTSMYVIGLGYPYWAINTRFLVTEPFILDQSRLGGPDVLGAAGGTVYIGRPPNASPISGTPLDHWGRPMQFYEGA
jgi:hypothetical protein